MTVAGLVDRVVNFLLAVAAPLAVVMALYAGFLFLTAGGSEDRVRTAKRAVTYAVIGIAVLVVAKGITSIIISFLQ